MHELDTKRHLARVQMPDRDNMISGWLQVLVRSSHGDKDYGLPKVGNQVACIFDANDESGCVLGAVYSDADPPTADSETIRRFEFEDGGAIEYDRSSHVLKVTIGDGFLELAGNAQAVALADLVVAELSSLASAVLAHTHVCAAPTLPSGPPVGFVYSPGQVGSAKVKSA